MSWSRVLWQWLVQMKARLAAVIVALILLSLAHSLLLLLVGPLLLAFLADPNRHQLTVAQLLPQLLLSLWPERWSMVIAVQDLAFYLPFLILLAGWLKALSTYWFQMQQQYISLKIACRYRELLFDSLLAQEYRVLQSKGPGQWMSMVVNDVHLLQIRFSELTMGLLRDLAIVIAALVTLFVIHPLASIILVALTPILGWITGKIGRKIASYTSKWQEQLGQLSQGLLSIRRRFEFIKAQKGEVFERHHFDQINHNYFELIQGSLMIRSGFAPWLEFVGLGAFVGLIWLKGEGLIFRSFNGPELFQIFAALGMMLRPLRNLGEQLTKYQETRGALRESLGYIHGYLTSEPAIRPKDSIAFDQGWQVDRMVVGHADRVVVEVNDLHLSAGQTIAVVGPSGGGKSTLLATLAGLWQPQVYQGSVPWQAWRRSSSYVSQKPFLFSDDTILRDNLCYGIPSDVTDAVKPLDDAALVEALHLVGLDKFANVQRLHRHLGRFGEQCSGGEWQRLTLARLFLQGKSLWLLDEPTSAVDQQTESQLTRLLLAEAKRLKVRLVMITHRLRHLADFDEVWFVAGGRLERGTHQALLGNQDYRGFVESFQDQTFS